MHLMMRDYMMTFLEVNIAEMLRRCQSRSLWVLAVLGET